jgi:hypothetical protein
MKNTLFAVAAASLGMLVTSGIIAYALAAPAEIDTDAFISELIEIQARQALDTRDR